MKNTVFIILVSALVAVTVGFISNPKNNQSNWIQYGLKQGEKIGIIHLGTFSMGDNVTTGTIKITEHNLFGIEHKYNLNETKTSGAPPMIVVKEEDDKIIVNPSTNRTFTIIYPKSSILYITKPSS